MAEARVPLRTASCAMGLKKLFRIVRTSLSLSLKRRSTVKKLLLLALAMLLAFPCPVCASAILLACVMAQLLYPTASGLLRHGLPLVVAVLYLGTFAGLWAIRRFTGVTALHLAGWMMLLIAAYFVLLLMISPQWTQLDRIHALASHSIPLNLNAAGLWAILAIGLVAFLYGMWRGHRKHQ